MRNLCTCIIALSLILSGVAPAAEYVWLEAEQADQLSAGGSESDPALSNGTWRWINNQDTAADRYLAWDAVEVSEGGTYRLYVRKFWKHGPLRWRFGAMGWQTLTKDETVLLDTVSVGGNSASWVALGEVALTAGTHSFRVEMIDAVSPSAIDCFCLTNQLFIPRGRLKPDEKYGTAPEGWFPFEPGLDEFAPSPIDLRYLNESQAGDGGFITAVDGAFVHGDTGEPVRFWAANGGAGIAGLDDISLAYMARQLAKYGVNMVRYHSPVYATSGSDAGTLDPRLRENVHRLVAALKAEGIYTTISLYFPLWLQPAADHATITGYTGDGSKPAKPFALLFFNEAYQELYRGWWREVLHTPDPQTGVALVDEPAVAAIELVNEDSFLFWTFDPGSDPSNIPSAHVADLERRFAAWLIDRYGSLDAAFAAWGSDPTDVDDLAAGRVAFRHLWSIQEYRSPRDQDTVRFLAGVQMAFFTATRDWLKQDLGYAACVSCSNWKTANDEILGPADKYSNTVGDHMDRHGYFGPSVTGDGSQKYSVRVDHAYHDRAAVRFDPKVPGDPKRFALPLMDHSYDGKPSIISETSWAMPNRYRADMPVVFAAYGALLGTDGIYHFSLGGPSWSQMIGKWPLQAPVTMGQFPAAALLYRRGYVGAGEQVADIHLDPEDVFALTGTPAPEVGSFDLTRLDDVPDDGIVLSGDILDPLTYLAGRIAVSFDAGDSTVADLSASIDRDAQRVTSTTGELQWDYAAGLVRIDTPFANGVTGFLAAAGTVGCGGASFTLDVPYGSALLVALDGRPLASSRRMLLQVMSEERNHGFATETTDDGRQRITDLGGPPLVVRQVTGSVELTRDDAAACSVTALDLNGYPVAAHGDAAAIELRGDTLYYLIEAPATAPERTIRVRRLRDHTWRSTPDAPVRYHREGIDHFAGLDPSADCLLEVVGVGEGDG